VQGAAKAVGTMKGKAAGQPDAATPDKASATAPAKADKPARPTRSDKAAAPAAVKPAKPIKSAKPAIAVQSTESKSAKGGAKATGKAARKPRNSGAA
jgi:Cu2+-exporting ATPase